MFFRRYGKLLLAILFIFLVVEVVLIAPTVIEEGEKTALEDPLVESDMEEVDQIARGIHLVEAGDGQQEWELWADEAKSLKIKETWSLTQVKAIFFGEDGTEFTVTGKRGELQTVTKDMKVSGDVNIRSTNGYLFKTQSVSYSSTAKILTTPDFLEMYGPKDQAGHAIALTGRGLKASLESSRIRVLNDVRATKMFKDNKRVNIRSNRANFSGNTKMAEFVDNVIIDFENMRITGPKAEFQYDSQSKVVESMYVDGGVRVSDQDKWATSKNVKVDFNKDQYTFKGSPRVVQNNDELRGQEIIFLDGGKRVKVIGARARVDENRVEN